ncbi:MAG TPA: hypothetical protein VHW92_02120 [Mycobacteriales bacterium]|jgi:hypothetical protein|nr:hypothetical protein [Mycobacteriales bacterium]
MSEPHALDDERLLARLGAIAREIDPAPQLVREIGYAAYSLHRLDDELALLVADSRSELDAVRSVTSEVRLMSFQSPGISVEIEVSRGPSQITAIGQLMPADAAAGGQVHLETPAGNVASVRIDSEGRFEFSDVTESMVRFRVEAPGVKTVTTCWVELGAD